MRSYSILSRAPIRIAAFGVAATVLAGCSLRTPLEPVDLASARTIGITSTCGETLSREANAVFNVGLDDRSYLKVPEWGLSARVVQGFRDRMPALPQIIDVELDRTGMTLATNWYKKDDPNAFWQPVFANAKPKADIYVVIFPRNSATYWHDSRDQLAMDDPTNAQIGFGLFTRSFARAAHAVCGAYVFDARKQEVVRRLSQRESIRVPRDLNKDTWSEYSDDQLRQVRDYLSPMATHIGEALAEKLLQESNLAPAAAK